MTNTQRTDEQKCCITCYDFWNPMESCSNKDCPCHTPHTPSSDWEKEFDRNFMSQGELLHVGDGEDDASDIKSFIHTHIEKAVREENERIKDWVTTILFAHPELKDEIISFLDNKES